MKHESVTKTTIHALVRRLRDQRRSRVEARRVTSRPPVLRRVATTLALLALGVVLWAVQFDRRDVDTRSTAAGWGAESIDAATTDPLDWLPMTPANACGLGASSCFKCHNGKRAGAPTSDPVKAPWHLNHAKVNNSCVGCHKGNPRVTKEEVAHAKMVPKPRDNSAESCATCHTSDLAKVQAAYANVGGK